jgi:hypothetical protein
VPKVRAFDVVVEGRPSEVAARLRAATRPRLFTFARALGGTGVATGTLEADGPDRTRICGQCALPAFLVWYCRLAWLALLPLLVGAVWLAWSGGAAFLPFALFFPVALVGSTLGIGLNISSAEADLEPLEQALLALAGNATAPRVAQRQTERA